MGSNGSTRSAVLAFYHRSIIGWVHDADFENGTTGIAGTHA